MPRPGDWDAIGLTDDPTPGDPETISQLAEVFQHLGGKAREIYNAIETVMSTADDSVFSGETADALRGKVDKRLRGHVEDVAWAFETSAQALRDWHGVVVEQQARADAALNAGRSLPKDDPERQRQAEIAKQAGRYQAEQGKSVSGRIRTVSHISLPISACKLFWEAFQWLAIILIIPALVLGGPIALLALGVNLALFIKTVVDFANGNAQFLDLFLAGLGLIAPTTKALPIFSILKGIGKGLVVGAKGLYQGIRQIFTRDFVFTRLLPGLSHLPIIGSVAIHETGLVVVSAIRNLPAFVGGIVRSPVQFSLNFTRGAGDLITGWSSVALQGFGKVTGWTGAAFRAGTAFVGRELGGTRFLRLILPVDAGEIRAFGFWGALKIGFVDRGLLGRNVFGAPLAGAVGHGIGAIPVNPPTPRALDDGFGSISPVVSAPPPLEIGPLGRGADFGGLSGHGFQAARHLEGLDGLGLGDLGTVRTGGLGISVTGGTTVMPSGLHVPVPAGVGLNTVVTPTPGLGGVTAGGINAVPAPGVAAVNGMPAPGATHLPGAGATPQTTNIGDLLAPAIRANNPGLGLPPSIGPRISEGTTHGLAANQIRLGLDEVANAPTPGHLSTVRSLPAPPVERVNAALDLVNPPAPPQHPAVRPVPNSPADAGSPSVESRPGVVNPGDAGHPGTVQPTPRPYGEQVLVPVRPIESPTPGTAGKNLPAPVRSDVALNGVPGRPDLSVRIEKQGSSVSHQLFNGGPTGRIDTLPGGQLRFTDTASGQTFRFDAKGNFVDQGIRLTRADGTPRFDDRIIVRDGNGAARVTGVDGAVPGDQFRVQSLGSDGFRMIREDGASWRHGPDGHLRGEGISFVDGRGFRGERFLEGNELVDSHGRPLPGATVTSAPGGGYLVHADGNEIRYTADGLQVDEKIAVLPQPAIAKATPWDADRAARINVFRRPGETDAAVNVRIDDFAAVQRAQADLDLARQGGAGAAVRIDGPSTGASVPKDLHGLERNLNSAKRAFEVKHGMSADDLQLQLDNLLADSLKQRPRLPGGANPSADAGSPPPVPTLHGAGVGRTAPPPPPPVRGPVAPGQVRGAPPVVRPRKVAAPSFKSSFRDPSYGVESELSGFVVALPKNADRSFAFVTKVDTGEPLVMVTKDMSNGRYGNPAGLAQAQRGDWQTHTVELINYPSLLGDAGGTAARVDATHFLLTVFKDRLGLHNHRPLEPLISPDGRFALHVANDRHVIASGQGVGLDEPASISMPPSGQQVTIGVKALDFGAHTTDESRLLADNARWYRPEFRNDEALRSLPPNHLDSPEQVETAYTYLKSIIDHTGGLVKKHGTPIGDFPGAAPYRGLTDPKVKNEWGVLPKTKPSVILDSLSIGDREKTLKLLREAPPIGDVTIWKEVRQYILNGGEVAGHGINDATIGGEPALLFEFRSVPDKLKHLVPQEKVAVVVVTDPLAELGSGRPAAVRKIDGFVREPEHRSAFADWYRTEFRRDPETAAFYQNKSIDWVLKTASARYKAEWISTHHPQVWQEITGKPVVDPPTAPVRTTRSGGIGSRWDADLAHRNQIFIDLAGDDAPAAMDDWARVEEAYRHHDAAVRAFDEHGARLDGSSIGRSVGDQVRHNVTNTWRVVQDAEVQFRAAHPSLEPATIAQHLGLQLVRSIDEHPRIVGGSFAGGPAPVRDIQLVGSFDGHSVIRQDGNLTTSGPDAGHLRVEGLDNGSFRVTGSGGRTQRYDVQGNLLGEGLALIDPGNAGRTWFTEEDGTGGVRLVDGQGTPIPFTRADLTPNGLIRVVDGGNYQVYDGTGVLRAHGHTVNLPGETGFLEIGPNVARRLGTDLRPLPGRNVTFDAKAGEITVSRANGFDVFGLDGGVIREVRDVGLPDAPGRPGVRVQIERTGGELGTKFTAGRAYGRIDALPDRELRLTDAGTGRTSHFDAAGLPISEGLRIGGIPGAADRVIVQGPGGAPVLTDLSGQALGGITVRPMRDGGFRVIHEDGRAETFRSNGLFNGESLALAGGDQTWGLWFVERGPDGQRVVDVDGVPRSGAVAHELPDGRLLVIDANEGIRYLPDGMRDAAGTRVGNAIHITESDGRIRSFDLNGAEIVEVRPQVITPTGGHVVRADGGDLRWYGEAGPLALPHRTAPTEAGGVRIEIDLPGNPRHGEFHEFDASGKLVRQGLPVVRNGRSTAYSYVVDHVGGTWSRLDGTDGSVGTGAFHHGKADLSGAGNGRLRLFSSTAKPVEVFERRWLSDGLVLDSFRKTDTLGFGWFDRSTTWVTYDERGKLVGWGRREYDTTGSGWRDVDSAYRTVREYRDGLQKYHSGTGHVLATKQDDGSWQWVRYDDHASAIVQGDRVRERIGDGWTDTFTRTAGDETETVIAQQKWGAWHRPETAGQYREYTITRGTDDTLARSGTWQQHSRHGKVSGSGEIFGGDLMTVIRQGEQRPPVWVRESPLLGNPRPQGAAAHLAEDNGFQIFRWSTPERHGDRYVAMDGATVDIDAYGNFVRSSGTLADGTKLKVGDHAKPPEVSHPDGGLAWEAGTDRGWRLVDGTSWQDVKYVDGHWIAVRESRPGGVVREYADGAKRSLWTEHDAHGNLTGLSTPNLEREGTFVEATGGTGNGRWVWREVDANETAIGGRGGERQYFRQSSDPSLSWDDSFRDFDAAGNLARERRMLDKGRYVESWWTPQGWRTRAFDKAGGAVPGSPDLIRVWSTGDGVWSHTWIKGSVYSRDILPGVDGQAGQVVRETRPAGGGPVRVREYRLEHGLTQYGQWKEFDHGSVVRERKRSGSNFVEADAWRGQWKLYDADGSLLGERLDNGLVFEVRNGKLQLTGNEYDFRGPLTEIRGWGRRVREAQRMPWLSEGDRLFGGGSVVPPEGGAFREARYAPVWKVVAEKALLEFAQDFVLEFGANLAVNAIVAAAQDKPFTGQDALKSLLNATVGSAIKTAVGTALFETKLGGSLRDLKFGLANVDGGKHWNRRPMNHDKNWANEWAGNETATRWRGGVFDFGFNLGPTVLSGFVNGTLNAAIFGVTDADGHKVKLTGWDAIGDGSINALASLTSGVSTALVKNVATLFGGSRFFHRQGFADFWIQIPFRVFEKSIQSGFLTGNYRASISPPWYDPTPPDRPAFALIPPDVSGGP